MSIDDIIFNKQIVIRKEVINNMATTKQSSIKNAPHGIGLDVGTGNLLSCSFVGKRQVKFTMLRDCFFSIDKEMFNKSMFNKNQMKFIESGNMVHIVGEDALTMAKIQNTSTKRPLAKGVINPNEREAAPILKEMIKHCLNKYKKKPGEKLVYSVPGPMLGNEDFNVEYHSLSIQSLIKSLGFDPVPLNEGYAVIISELEKAKEVTGIGFSFGAGLVNVAFVYKGMLMFDFSINKSGDFIDKESSKACGVAESMINHIKETQLNLSKSEFDTIPEERALIFTYRHVIKNVLINTINIFNSKDNVNVIEPIPLIISGGTTLPKGFITLFKNELKLVELPFEYTKIIPAKDRLSSVAKGCMLAANNMENDNL